MKHCPKCRVESRSDAEWCWHCGYAYEDAQPPPSPPSEGEEVEPAPEPTDPR